MPDIIDFEMVAFGNSYFITQQCGGSAAGYKFASYFQGYNATVRTCWDSLCGAAAAVPAADCFSGQLLCQHGATDGLVTTSWACAKALAGGVPSKYMPFVVCMSTRFLGITTQGSFQATVKECADVAGLDREQVATCASGEEGRKLLITEARATIPHSGVPYVLIDGEPLDDVGCVACGDGIMQKVCEAWRNKTGLGGEPPACQGIFGIV